MKNQAFIDELAETIKKANAFYRLGTPIKIQEIPASLLSLIDNKEGMLTDNDYDYLLETLSFLDSNNEIFQNGIIETIEIVSSSRKRKLAHPMYSLNKESNIKDVQKWIKTKKLPETTLLVITPKYDGVSVLKNEKTSKATSRGDGIEGQDITPHYKKLNPETGNIGEQISEEFYSIGELIIPKATFEENKHIFIRDNGEPYKNPRNMVAGLVNNDSVSPFWEYVDHVRYGVADDECKLNKLDQLDLIFKTTGFETPYEYIMVSELTAELLDELYYRWGIFYEIDGLVIDIDNKELRKQLGRESNNNPAYARAYKANWVKPITTTVKFVEWNISKEGKLKPIAHIEPIQTEGVTVSKASCYNAKFISKNGIDTGAIVEVIRSGSVIPKIVNVLEPVFRRLPTSCPSCNDLLKWNDNKVDLICDNPHCEDMLTKKLTFFFSSLDFDYFGEKIVNKFYHNGFDSVSKILKMTAAQISEMDGMGESSAETILSQFEEKIYNNSYENLGHASGCFTNLGSKRIKMIIDGLGGMEKFEKFKSKYFLEDIRLYFANKLVKINGISYVTAYEFLNGIVLFDKFLKDTGIEIKEKELMETKSDKFKNRSFVFTGIRDAELEKVIIENGGEIKGGVSKNVTDLIVKDKNSTSSKITKAREIGITIHQIDEFKSNL